MKGLSNLITQILGFVPTRQSSPQPQTQVQAQIQPPSYCPDYSSYAKTRHEPFSTGRHALPYQRPAPSCRTFNSSVIESFISNMSTIITDPDLYRLFENTYPNTLDTAIKWHGSAANNSAEELTFIITGDINAMWLRDSANQLASYLPFLAPSSSRDSLASLYRGVINLQARYLLTSPFCNSFQPPSESGIPPATNSAASSDTVYPPYDPEKVFECKYELDSLASFLQISAQYHAATNDTAFFGRFQWLEAVQTVLDTAKAMMTPTYGPEGQVLESPYTFTRMTTRTTETLANDGLGNPVARDIGLIRSAFRPSDDSTIFQFLIPSNMMFAKYAGDVASIVSSLSSLSGTQPGLKTPPANLSTSLSSLSTSLRQAISKHAIISLPTLNSTETTEKVYAYEIDGYGSFSLMDDANLPSLLSAPLFDYFSSSSSSSNSSSDPVYQRTRSHLLGTNTNPYMMHGPVINAVGGPHAGPGMAWPMASIVRIMTSSDDEEIYAVLKELVGSTDGLGLIHESVNSFDSRKWTREWFSWANGLFGQMVWDLVRRNKGRVLRRGYQ
ncbi:hypothetical protein NEUTE1DRAFT_148325 [Neurospora tetrasperma FGSC 2508]|uniref:DUF1237-domain-containing protein n=1 Tax=Neurospora tetrasperma (strain FGSC 2508 / ATCC MYA-4615 / P0657) TaxID=510951 RepID=F8MSP6_NEUT8|nr:uncharacterized protein NEUTE1DRAFT_148325 [Neurospora tetrasperma FGSC 2508]EGO55932.1 hypothetical protein NEUTE1DRAFT_148325 [Neurospora tetrasperma FGSC 2508]EGZ68811.1 Uncharacterized conserved protein UCP028846 [Neurospora tetrasperma FGSC 2509]